MASLITVEGTFDPTAHLSCQHICTDSHTQPSVIKLLIKMLKRDQFGTGAYIFLWRTDSDLCLVTAIF